MSVWTALTEGQSARLYRTGQLIYLQGTVPECFYFLESGEVRSFISTDTGEERILTIHRAGDVMGEAAFFDGGPRITSASALTDCRVFSVDEAHFQRVLEQNPNLALPMLHALGHTVRTLSAHVDSAALPAYRRVARHLLALPCSLGGCVSCTHERVGQAVGLSRVTVSRALGELSRLGLVDIGYRCVTVTNRAALEAVAFPVPEPRGK